jgi:hypothetical protein
MLKTKTERVLALAVAFLAGCASRLVVPAAHAGEPVRRWEYACLEEGETKKVASKANEYGAQGWELAAAGGTSTSIMSWCFKRPLGPTASAQ